MPYPRSLFLVRHAIAAERSDKWPDDTERPLTHEGAARMRQAAEGLAALDVSRRGHHEPARARASRRPTSSVEALAGDGRLLTMPALAPGGSPAAVAEALAALQQGRKASLVGHEPGLGELGGVAHRCRKPLPFRKGGAAESTSRLAAPRARAAH